MRRENNQFSAPVPNGILYLVGGHEDKGDQEQEKAGATQPLEVLKAFIGLIENEDPIVELVTTGSAEGDASFADYKSAFDKLGLSRVGHIHHDIRSEILGDELKNDIVERVSKADAVYFSGGDQLKLTSIYGGTRFLSTLKERYISDRLIVGGTSAGAMALSTPMIYAGNKEVQQIAGGIKVTTGLEFLKDVCIDTHFIDRSRFVRMAQVIASNPACIGMGIEEDTAVIVREGRRAEVVGSGIVILIEGFGISDSNIMDHGSTEKIYIHDLNVSMLSAGCHYKIPRNNPPHW
ncbi:cyanophycinase [Arcticibacter pallidicorallinus]|uniref:Cyanophycinase n=1 Tax=Arcticibacter pallidicorallinus TaxID=1259464 RepID=A0A2T0UBR0_9SPHI|nr:cyanophycinase [Arcticibacter pallidicorallinus]PRY55332.1 cyanophycinase [Arcticibacter pallidicorallinus]